MVSSNNSSVKMNLFFTYRSLVRSSKRSVGENHFRAHVLCLFFSFLGPPHSLPFSLGFSSYSLHLRLLSQPLSSPPSIPPNGQSEASSRRMQGNAKIEAPVGAGRAVIGELGRRGVCRDGSNWPARVNSLSSGSVTSGPVRVDPSLTAKGWGGKGGGQPRG